MNPKRSQFFLYALVCSRTTADSTVPLDKFSAGNPVERRLNRIERVVAAYRGKIEQRQENALLVTFPSAGAAFLAACEMQHRCAALPQLSGQPFSLRIGAHLGILRQRAQDKATDHREIAKNLAAADDSICISDGLANELNQELRTMLRQDNLAKAHDKTIYQVDWQREIPMSAQSAESVFPSEIMHSISGGPSIRLQYGLKSISLSTEMPTINIGRDPQNDIAMADDRISRQHCRIERQGSDIVLTDDSTNGTCVVTEDGREYFVRKNHMILKGKGLLFFGRTGNGDRRGSVRFETSPI